MEYYSAFERKEILTLATTWMKLEDMLSEISQTQKDNTVWFHSYEVLKRGHTQRQAVEWWLQGAEGRGKWKIIV